jgi:hypothetical protein
LAGADPAKAETGAAPPAKPEDYRPEQSAAKPHSHSSEGVFEVAIAGHRSASVVNVATTRSAIDQMVELTRLRLQ